LGAGIEPAPGAGLERLGKFLSGLCQSGIATSADIVLKIKVFSEFLGSKSSKSSVFVVACVWRGFDFSGQL
jgi:hypothetical protein